MLERQRVKGSIVTSIYLKIREVVEEQVLFDLDVVNN